MPDDRAMEDQVGAYWDALVLGRETARLDLDDDVAVAIRRFHDLSASPPSTARQRVWQHVQSAIVARQFEREAPMPPSVLRGSSGPIVPTRLTGVAARRRGMPWRWLPAHLATAALLLLTLGLGYLVLGPGRADPDHPTAFPAAVGPGATPAPAGTTAETLLRVALPAALLPRGDQVGGILGHATLPPRTTTTWAATAGDACCPGIRGDYVLEGRFTVRAEDPIRMLRAGWNGTPETVAAGTEIGLGPGDAVLFPAATTITYTNPAAAPADLLFWDLEDDSRGSDGATPEGGPVPPGWVLHDEDDRPGLSVPAGPATLLLRRVDLAPDATFPGATGAVQFGVSRSVNTAGTPVAQALGTGSTGTVRNVGQDAVTAYILTLEPAGPEGGTPRGGTPAP